MKHLVSALAFFAISTVSHAAEPLLTPLSLQQVIQKPNVTVIDIRAPKDYATGHIEGAVNAPYGKWRGPASNPGELPALNKLTALVQGLGLSPNTHAIVVSSGVNDTDFGASARVYWTLKVLGLTNLSILNGGLKAWSAAGLPLSKTAPTIVPSDFKPTINDQWIITRDQLVQDTKSKRAVLVDARPAAFFNGETRHVAAKVPGTLPDAINVAHSTWFKPGTSQLIEPTQAKAIASKQNLANTNEEIVSFCNTGHWAATNWFVLSELVGDKDVKLYAGSMVEWSQSPEALPMQNVPNRFKQLMIDTKIWFDGL